VFWLNDKDVDTLKKGYVSVASTSKDQSTTTTKSQSFQVTMMQELFKYSEADRKALLTQSSHSSEDAAKHQAQLE
jgi:hypothetical protein